jgi:hypothetical protein
MNNSTKDIEVVYIYFFSFWQSLSVLRMLVVVAFKRAIFCSFFYIYFRSLAMSLRCFMITCSQEDIEGLTMS